MASARDADPAGLKWTGHALVDVGTAGLCAFAKKQAPEDLTLQDLDAASAFIEKNYYGNVLGTYLSCVFMNASFVQPNESSDKTKAFVTQYVRAHRAHPHPQVAGMRCVFSGASATSPLVRTHLPLFSGEDVLNFRPAGGSFVPVNGAFVVSVMFLPMAGRRSEGRLLIVHADDASLTVRFARRYLDDNRRLLSLLMPTTRAATHAGYEREQPMWDAQKKRYKMADAKGPRSLVISDLSMIAADALPNDVRPHPAALTAYLLSNSGQGPSLQIFQVPSGVVSFVARAAGAVTAREWRAVSERFWPVSGQEDDAAPARPMRKKNAGARVPGRAGWTRNPAFEDLCGIFDAGFVDRSAAASWLRRHVLGRRDQGAGDARYGDGSARSWKLAELFLTEVLGMREARIEAIRSFADKLAAWIEKKNDRKLYRALVFEKASELQYALRRVQRQSAESELLFGLDEYRNVWLHDDKDWYLVRDLICIRVVERLHALGFFLTHPEDALEADEEQPEQETAEEARA